MKRSTLLGPDHPDAPKYWMYETSGVLARDIKNYLDGEALDAPAIGRIKAYLWQWVKSPVWRPSGCLEVLRLRVMTITAVEDIRHAISMAEELGMDPL